MGADLATLGKELPKAVRFDSFLTCQLLRFPYPLFLKLLVGQHQVSEVPRNPKSFLEIPEGQRGAKLDSFFTLTTNTFVFLKGRVLAFNFSKEVSGQF